MENKLTIFQIMKNGHFTAFFATKMKKCPLAGKMTSWQICGERI